MTRMTELAGVIREAQRLDNEWLRAAAGRDDFSCTPWMPFPMFDFIALVAEAMLEAQGSSFLEVGCGIGTRMLLAQEIYGLNVQGIDRVPEYVEQARKLGLVAIEADAQEWGGYGNYDLLWFNRPFRDRDKQRQLEAKVWQDMRPGAVVIAANVEQPPPRSWWPVLDDHEVRRWIAQKPDTSAVAP